MMAVVINKALFGKKKKPRRCSLLFFNEEKGSFDLEFV